MLIAALYPAVSVNRTMRFAAVAPVPVVTHIKAPPEPFRRAAMLKPPNVVVYVPFDTHDGDTKEYFSMVPAVADVLRTI